MLRVILIDDSPTFLASFKALLGSFPAVQVVAVLGDGEQGLRAVAELAPDIVFLDMVMPGLSGMQVAAQLQRRQAPVRVVMVSLRDGESHRARVAALGVERFVCKNDLFDELPSILSGSPTASKAGWVRP